MNEPVSGTSDQKSRRVYRIEACLVALLVAAAAVFVYLQLTSPEKSLARVREDWEAIRKALSAICVDWSSFPSDTSNRRYSDPSIPLTFESDVGVLPKSHNAPISWPPHLLTTPVAYMTRIPGDPFKPGALYGYTCFDWKDKVTPLLILHSAGPNRRYEITLPQLRDQIAAYMATRIGSTATPQDRTALKQIVMPYLYDPTNGTRSAGDLVWLMDTGFDAWGWEREKGSWANTPPMDNPTSAPAEVTLAWATWRLGMPAPPTTGSIEQMNRTRMLSIIEPLEWHLRAAGTLEYPAGKGPCTKQGTIDAIRAKLGAIGADVWEHPRLLTPAEQAALEHIPQENRLWWGTIVPELGTGMTGIRQLPADKAYELVSLLGMSQVALALRDAGAGQTSQSLTRIRFARSALSGIDTRNATPREPSEIRIRAELERLLSDTEMLVLAGGRK
jgi:hypothetical protein